MNPNSNPEDPKLGQLLRETRPEAELPPRFQEAVWRRIADAESPVRSEAKGWLDELLAVIFRPRFALVTATLLIFAGAVLGMRKAEQTVREDAQSRYIAAVAPRALR